MANLAAVDQADLVAFLLDREGSARRALGRRGSGRSSGVDSEGGLGAIMAAEAGSEAIGAGSEGIEEEEGGALGMGLVVMEEEAGSDTRAVTASATEGVSAAGPTALDLDLDLHRRMRLPDPVTEAIRTGRERMRALREGRGRMETGRRRTRVLEETIDRRNAATRGREGAPEEEGDMMIGTGIGSGRGIGGMRIGRGGRGGGMGMIRLIGRGAMRRMTMRDRGRGDGTELRPDGELELNHQTTAVRSMRRPPDYPSAPNLNSKQRHASH